MYIVINKFLVKPKYQKGFVKETKRIWIKSYKKSTGFMETIIIENQQNPNEFLTIDIWKSKEHADKFFIQNLDKLLKVSNVPKKCIQRKGYKTIK